MELRAVDPVISQAVVAEGGRLAFLSGHVPMLAAGTIAGPGLEVQLLSAFESLQMTLRASGADSGDVARLTIYVRDYEPGQLAAIRRIRDRFVDPDRPLASALIGVAALFYPDVLVEVDAVAVLPDPA